MLALLAAMDKEVTAIRRHMAVEETVAGNGYRSYRGKYREKDVLLVVTGIGRERAVNAARSVLGQYQVTTLISFGFAGALSVESRSGDLLVCATLCDGEERPESACQSDADLVAGSLQVLVGGVTRIRQGKCVTVARPVLEPAAKQALGQAFQADIVDMESYWLGRIAAERQVPFVAVRAVSDTMLELLPPMGRLINAEGGMRWWRAVPHFLTHPRHLSRWLGHRQNAQRARTSLTTFLDRFVERFQ